MQRPLRLLGLVVILLARVGLAQPETEAEPAAPEPLAGGEGTDELIRTLHAPLGAQPISLRALGLGVACPGTVAPWRIAQGGAALLPPSEPEFVGRPIEVRIADSLTQCEQHAQTWWLLATGPWPQVATETVVLSLDEKRADASGSELEGAVLAWQSGEQSGSDVCFDLREEGGRQHCAWSLEEDVSADPAATRVVVFPRGARPGQGARFVDGFGRPVDVEALAQRPARVVLQRVFPQQASVDLSTGDGRVTLHHAEAVASASCEPLVCEVEGEQLRVRGSAAPVDSFEATLRLKPRVRVWDGKSLRSEVSGRASVVHCPMSVASGPPFRGNDEATVALQVGGPCARDVPRLEFRAGGGRRLHVIDTLAQKDATLVLLALGRVSAAELTLTATRQDSDVVVAAVRTPTRDLPTLRATLEVKGFPSVDFIPKNRWAEVHVAAPADDVYAVALPIAGVYEVRRRGRRSEVRGDLHAAGLTGLRLGVRSRRLPAELADHDLAVVGDPLLRSVHEANVPEPIADREDGSALVEVRCGGGDEGVHILPLGRTVNLPFALRDSCRVTFRRDLLRVENGTQRLRVRIEVFSVDGVLREGSVDQTLTLVPGDDPHHVYVDGIRRPFDRLVVRVAHTTDDTHYLRARQLSTEAPEAKWSAIFGTERARLYATTTIPAGLYRLSDREHSGLLSLNFGILSRLTWLDREGKEGMLKLESGLVVVGIGNAVSDEGERLTQVGAVVGLGFSVPFTNQSSLAQAALNIHAWLEVDVTRDEASGSDGRFAFIFGPSISIGNLGTNL